MSLSHWLGQPGFCPRFKEFLERNTTGHFSSINCARVDFLADVIDFKTATSSMRLAKAHFLWQNYLSECPNSNPDLPANLKRRVKKLLWADESGMDPQGLINETTFGTSPLTPRRPSGLCSLGLGSIPHRVPAKQCIL